MTWQLHSGGEHAGSAITSRGGDGSLVLVLEFLGEPGSDAATHGQARIDNDKKLDAGLRLAGRGKGVTENMLEMSAQVDELRYQFESELKQAHADLIVKAGPLLDRVAFLHARITEMGRSAERRCRLILDRQEPLLAEALT